MSIRTPLALAALALLAVPAVAEEKEKPKVVKPDSEWVAVVKDDKLSKDAPKDGVITDGKTFEKLWKSWRPDEKVPKVDFDKNVVVVTLSLGGPNKPKTNAKLADGDLKIVAFATRLGGEGFGYAIGVYPKEGIKKVNGKELPAK
jgi:hypothetical protein